MFLRTNLAKLDNMAVLYLFVHSIYFILMVTITAKCLAMPTEHKQTRNNLLICLFYRALPGILLGFGVHTTVQKNHILQDDHNRDFLHDLFIRCGL